MLGDSPALIGHLQLLNLTLRKRWENAQNKLGTAVTAKKYKTYVN
jgi:hypothetical protein